MVDHLDFFSRELEIRRILGMQGENRGQCPIPDHRGVAWLGDDDRAHGWGLVCNCLGVELQFDGAWTTDFWRPLSDVYRAIWTGRTIKREQKLSIGMRLVWTLFLAHRVGLLDPVPIALPALPPDADELEHKVAALYQLLAGLRVASGHELNTPLSVSLVMDYFGIKDRGKANAPLIALRDHKVLFGTRSSPRGYYEYVPWDQAERSSSNDREMRPSGVHPSTQQAIL